MTHSNAASPDNTADSVAMKNHKQCTALFDAAYIAWCNQKTANFRTDSFYHFTLFVKTQRQLLRALPSQGRDGFSCWHITFSSSLELTRVCKQRRLMFLSQSSYLSFLPSSFLIKFLSPLLSFMFFLLTFFQSFLLYLLLFSFVFLFLNVNPLTVSSLKG